MSQKHTPEPWRVLLKPNGTYIFGPEPTTQLILSMSMINLPEQSLPDANRIVACVNAMEGIEDPHLLRDHYEMAEVTIDALRSHDKRIRQLIKADENESTFDEVQRMKDQLISMLHLTKTFCPRTTQIKVERLIAQYK